MSQDVCSVRRGYSEAHDMTILALPNVSRPNIELIEVRILDVTSETARSEQRI